MFDNVVRNCNRIFWLKNEHAEAIRIWKMGKDIGFWYTREEDVVIGHLQDRDNGANRKVSTSRMETIVSDNEDN